MITILNLCRGRRAISRAADVGVQNPDLWRRNSARAAPPRERSGAGNRICITRRRCRSRIEIATLDVEKRRGQTAEPAELSDGQETGIRATCRAPGAVRNAARVERDVPGVDPGCSFKIELLNKEREAQRLQVAARAKKVRLVADENARLNMERVDGTEKSESEVECLRKDMAAGSKTLVVDVCLYCCCVCYSIWSIISARIVQYSHIEQRSGLLRLSFSQTTLALSTCRI